LLVFQLSVKAPLQVVRSASPAGFSDRQDELDLSLEAFLPKEGEGIAHRIFAEFV
jgi:hypothetical protein